LARDGYQVALHSRRSTDVGQRMAGELAGASYHQADLADEQAARGLIASVLTRHGRLDVLVNNAGESIRRMATHAGGQPDRAVRAGDRGRGRLA
jgi:NAD(P)-dependent dehydrogenase (short-subunit alcohol dehydrogenase family)